MIKVIIIGFGNLGRSFARLVYSGSLFVKNLLICSSVCQHTISEIEIVAIFDILKRHLDDASSFCSNCSKNGITVSPGILLDDVPPRISRNMKIVTISENRFREILNEIDCNTAILSINSFFTKSARRYVEILSEKGISVINSTPIKLANDPSITRLFTERKVGIVGDYIRGYFDSWILTKSILELFNRLNLNVKDLYALEYIGGLEGYSLINSEGKNISKKITSLLNTIVPNAHDLAYSSDWYFHLKQYREYRFILNSEPIMETPIELNVSVRLDSSIMSALVLIDTVIALKLAVEKGYYGRIKEICDFGFLFSDFMIKPLDQIYREFENFIRALSQQ